MQVVITDGGRLASGFKALSGDCVCRSIVIATGLPYREVYDRLAEGNATQRSSKHTGGRTRSASQGINVRRKWFKDYMTELGFEWNPTMMIGTGCQVHLHDGELPDGRLVVSLSKHYTCVIDGVIYDTHDPQRDGIVVNNGIQRSMHRCVYGYWSLQT